MSGRFRRAQKNWRVSDWLAPWLCSSQWTQRRPCLSEHSMPAWHALHIQWAQNTSAGRSVYLLVDFLQKTGRHVDFHVSVKCTECPWRCNKFDLNQTPVPRIPETVMGSCMNFAGLKVQIMRQAKQSNWKVEGKGEREMRSDNLAETEILLMPLPVIEPETPCKDSTKSTQPVSYCLTGTGDVFLFLFSFDVKFA